jgi:(E)-4-hydroxy-3-methylbut-2-enyl-diphosphate synthase
VKAGVASLRLNPGTLGGREKLDEVARALAGSGTPVRVGVNAGSLERELLDEDGHATAEAMVESAARQAELLEARGVSAIKVSLKASDAERTLAANRLWAAQYDLPVHLGLTEAGTLLTGTVRSVAVLSQLLAEGIGDTIRISLAGDPLDEVRVGLELLRTLGLREGGIRVVACPTCGRCAARFDVAGLAGRLEKRVAALATSKSLTVAVMGCAVNGPGEAREADVGVAGGSGQAVLFRRGVKVGRIREDEAVERLCDEVKALLAD